MNHEPEAAPMKLQSYMHIFAVDMVKGLLCIAPGQEPGYVHIHTLGCGCCESCHLDPAEQPG